MVININEFGQTLAIGALAILFLYLLIFRIFGASLGKFISKKVVAKTEISSIVLGTFFLSLLYVTGITIEELSRGAGNSYLKGIIPLETDVCHERLLKINKNDKIYILEDPTINTSAKVISSIFPVDSRSIIKINSKDTIKLYADDLLIKLYTSGIIQKLIDNGLIYVHTGFDFSRFHKTDSIQNSIKPILDYIDNIKIDKSFLTKYEEFKTFSQHLFYYAKNEVFTHKNYFDELRTIESRMHFSRSLVLLNLAIAFVSIIILIAITCNFIRVSQSKKERTRYFDKLKILLIITIVSLSIFWAANNAYFFEQKGYCQRVYGYFTNMHTLPNIFTNNTID